MNFAVPNREKQVRVQAPFFFSSFVRPSLFPNKLVVYNYILKKIKKIKGLALIVSFPSPAP
jgi:hypothetical protein